MQTRKPRLLRLFGRFGRDRRAVSAVEFALLAPIMITLYFGCVEISDGVAADRKVSLTAAALANLAAQTSSISGSDMTNILDAASAIIAPYDSSKLKVTVSCLNIASDKSAKVKWSETKNGTARAINSTYTFDSSTSALDVANTQLILAEASYDYTPIVGMVITGTITLSDRMFMSPRISTPDYAGTTCS
jgi:Flp pilus assembly protein TadG